MHFNYPDTWVGVLGTIVFYAIFVAITYPSVRRRCLPWHYSLYGLFFITGSVYVVTLPRRGDRERAFRKSVRLDLAEHHTFLSILSVGMGMLVFNSVVFVVLETLSLFGLVALHVNGEPADGAGDYAIAFLVTLGMLAIGLFHFRFTRKRVRALMEGCDAGQADEDKASADQ
jgi:hypothetical protein